MDFHSRTIFGLSNGTKSAVESTESRRMVMLAQCSDFPSLHPNCYKKTVEPRPVLPKTYKMFLDSKKAESNAAR